MVTSLKVTDVHARLPLPVFFAIELGLHCHMCHLCSIFEEDGTKTSVAIVDNRYFGHTHTHTHRQTYTQLTRVVLYLSNATDNKDRQLLKLAVFYNNNDNNNNIRICIPPYCRNFRGGTCHSLERMQADPLYLSKKLIS